VGNLGNEGSLDAMIRHIRSALPNAEVFCICTVPERVSKDFAIPTVAIHTTPGFWWFYSENRLLRALVKIAILMPRGVIASYRKFKHFKKVDVMIVPGTGILDDFGEGPLGMPFETFMWCLMARLRGVKVKFVSVGAGPVHHPISRWFVKTTARLADYRSYRDDISKDFMRSIGLDTKEDFVCPDLAFSLPRPERFPDIDCDTRQLTVGIGVMAYFGWTNRPDVGEHIYKTYISKIAQFGIWVLAQKHRLCLFIGDATDAQAVDDVRTEIERMMDGAAEGRLTEKSVHSLGDLMREMAETDIVVATRFHNIVCALMVNRVVLSCGYADKNDVLLAEMGLDRFCQHIENLDVDRLKNQFSELVQDRRRIQIRIEQKDTQYRDRLATQYATVFAEYLTP
jgi:polysaccharide pyruvyl transferase WcaK-like protein